MSDRIKTGIYGLDVLLHGGIIKGHDMLLSGPCGTGKTIIGMQYVYYGAMKLNEPGLFVTLEERKKNLHQNMKGVGFDLEAAEKSGNLIILGGRAAGLKLYMKKIDAKINHIIDEIEEIIKEKNIKRVVIDSISLMTMLLKTEEEKRTAVAMLCNKLSCLGCTSLLISEAKEGTMTLSRHGFEEFVVDGVIVLYLIRQGSKFIPGITIRKMRGSSHEKEIKMYEITKEGIKVYPEQEIFTEI